MPLSTSPLDDFYKVNFRKTLRIEIYTNIQNKINSFLTNDEVEKFEKFELKNLHVKLQNIKNQNHKYLNQKEPILIDSTTINLYETIGIETRLLV